MASITPKQVAGRHFPMFEIYYVSLDPAGKGQVPAMDAAKFLKRSGLSDGILSKIWDLSDPSGKGYLDKLGVFIALKLVSFAQSGREVSMNGILDDNVPEPEMSASRPISDSSARAEPPKSVAGPPPAHPPPPVMHSSPSPVPPSAQPTGYSSGGYDWTIREEDLIKYRQIFNGLGPEGGKVSGMKAKTMLMDSKLPVEILGKIWDLADVDKDGALSEIEFAICIHFIYKSLEKIPLPDGLPIEMQKLLVPQVPRKASLIPVESFPSPVLMHMPSVPTPPSTIAPPIIPTMPSSPPLMPVKDNWIVPYDERATFKSLFHSTDLDHDGYVSGNEIKGLFLKSGLAQSTLAHIWNLCDTDQSGKLTADQFTLAMWLVSNAVKGIQPPEMLTAEMIPPGMTAPKPPREPELNPEFELLMKEINELTQEKLNLEMEIAAKESDKKIKNGETKSLQSELDTLAATLKQLENQKGVAQGKLSELDGQVSALRFQAEEQESNLVVQEKELAEKAAELDGLDNEERQLNHDIESCGNDIEKLGSLLQETLLQISQFKTRISSLKELEETMKTSVTKFTSAIDSNSPYTVTEPELRDVKSELDELIGLPSPKYVNGDVNNTTNGFSTRFDEFSGSGPTPSTSTIKTEHTSSSSWDQDPFAALHAPTFASIQSQQQSDPFAPASSSTLPDPFAPSGIGRGHAGPSISPGFGRDPFGQEPFESEQAPALPPKRPPPRPAPPKSAPSRPPPPRAAPAKPQDPFSQGDNFDADFANFANFDAVWGPSPSSGTSSSSSLSMNMNNFNNNNDNNSTNQRNTTTNTTKTQNSNHHNHLLTKFPQLEFTEDPFKNYRYEDPFANNSDSVDPFGESLNKWESK